MGERDVDGSLNDLLRTAVGGRLEPEGWRELPGPGDDPHLLAVFGKPLNAEFMVAAQIWQPTTVSWRRGQKPEPVQVSHLSVGISYEPLRRLYPLLGRFEYAVLCHYDEDDDEYDEQEDEEDANEEYKDGEDGPAWLVEVARPEDVEAAADKLAELVREQSASLEPEIESVDELLQRLRSTWSEHDDMRCAAVLAAAGRYDEARQTLNRLDQSAPHVLYTRRAARQLGRWIDSGGDPALLPSQAPPRKRDDARHSARPSFNEMLVDVREQHRARDAALTAVREHSAGKDRAELRAMLQQELARRDTYFRPIRIEMMLDHLHDEPGDSVKQTVGLLTRVGRGALKLWREREIPDLTAPAWLDPPQLAAYEFPHGDRWVAVVLSDETQAWLDEVSDRIPSILETSRISAWARWEPEPRQDRSALTVYLAEKRIGTLSRDDTSAFEDIIAAAAFRDEFPLLEAMLTRRDQDPRYVIEIAAPAPTAAASQATTSDPT